MSYIEVAIQGSVGSLPTERQTQTGKKYVTLAIVVREKNSEDAEWVNVSAFEQAAAGVPTAGRGRRLPPARCSQAARAHAQRAARRARRGALNAAADLHLQQQRDRDGHRAVHLGYAGSGAVGADRRRRHRRRFRVYAQQREADTGDGVLVVDDDDCLGVDFTRQWRSPTHNTAGLPVDTGDDFSEPVVLAGDRLRVRIVPAGGTVSGRLYIWTRE